MLSKSFIKPFASVAMLIALLALIASLSVLNTRTEAQSKKGDKESGFVLKGNGIELKSGFEFVRKGKNRVTVRRLNKPGNFDTDASCNCGDPAASCDLQINGRQAHCVSTQGCCKIKVGSQF